MSSDFLGAKMLAAVVILSLLSLTLAQTESKCGTVESDYAPCVTRERGDSLFKHCCQQYAPAGCQELCQYETDELTARNLVRPYEFQKRACL